ncbi:MULTISPECIES: TonB-dependent receptor domain-containing protein [Paracoccus]|jgi:hemoglobin/transferrin/lactoferrin receptor protein|uniref:TonB-dependent receptor domain-containing protein n=1 Tax=Paracoccus TaxID=265 RepID=UPI00258A5D43|nr:TonB-dependent receptor [Paracoccus sp. (in: a-proteobacteria)]
MPRHSIRGALLAGTACLTALTFTAPLLAQERAGADSAQSTYVLDQIVLRAGKPKVASEVPQSVSVVDSRQLEDIAPIHIGEVLATVPGVAGVGSGSFFGQGFNIRGFGSSGAAASESGIVQLIDGEEKYYESYRQGALFVEPDFLRQVEVLRGPGSSTLYGSGALGGVIAMETIEAGDLIAEGQTFGGRTKLGYASNPDTVLGSVALGWRPAEDFEALAAFAWRKLGDTKDADGNTTVRANSKTPNLLLKAKKTFGDQYVAFSYQHLEAKGDDQDFNQLEGAQVGLFPGFPGWGVGDITTRDQTARFIWGWNPEDNRYVDLTATLSYTNTLKDVRQGDDPDEPIMDSLLGERDYRLWKFKLSNVADLSGAGYDHHLTTGAEVLKQDRSSSVPSSSHPEAYTRAWAAYALSELTWGDLTINSGLRYEKQRTEPKSSVTVTDDTYDADSVEPQVAAIYRLNDSLSVFGSVAFVNRMPTVDELYDSFMGGAPSGDLKDEKGKNIELGLSYHGSGILTASDEAVVKLTLFRNHIDDMIVRTNAPAPMPAYVNIDRAYLRGGELEATYSVAAWEFGAAFSVVNGVDQDGADLDTLPNNRVTLQAIWQASDALRLGLRSTLADGRDKLNGTHRAGYGVHDVFATWVPQGGAAAGIEVHVGVDNVTDRDYTPATWFSGPAPGRNFKLSVSRSF